MKLPEWLPLDAWNGWVEMRKRIKKPMTERAEELRIKDLAAFHAAGEDVGAILDQSTANNWTDLYPLKERRDASTRGSKSKLPQLGKHGQATAENAQEWLADEPMAETLEQKKQFATLFTGLSDYYNHEMSRAKLGIYWQGLRQYSYEAIEKACWAHTQLPDEAGRWMPKNADIIKMIEGGTDDRAQVAWSKVDQAVRVRGTWDDVIFDDATIHRVLADMGGWILVGSKDDKEWPFVAKEFQQRYRAYAQRGGATEYPAQLTGQANAHNRAQGMPLLPAVLYGDPEKAKLVYRRGSGVTLVGMQDVRDTIKQLSQ